MIAACNSAHAQQSSSVKSSVARNYTSSSASPNNFESGYGNARDTVSQPFNPSTRDANNNRLIENGIIMSPGSSNSLAGGASIASSGASATAVGNLLNVNIVGSWNTVILNNNQTNNGNITATATNNGVTVKKDGTLN